MIRPFTNLEILEELGNLEVLGDEHLDDAEGAERSVAAAVVQQALPGECSTVQFRISICVSAL